MKFALLLIALLSGTAAHAQGISQLDQWRATTTPFSAITTNISGKNIYAPFSSATTSSIYANTYCIGLASPDCITSWPSGGGGGSASFGQAWELSGGFLSPTTTVPLKLADQATALQFGGTGERPLLIDLANGDGAFEYYIGRTAGANNALTARDALSLHIDTAKSVLFQSSGFDTLFAVNGGTGDGFFKGDVTAPSFIGALTGNADTATALASNPANCSAGNYPLGVDASGAAESCTADANTTYTAGDHLTLTGTDFDVDDDFLLNTGDTGSGLYAFANSSTTLASFGYASSTVWRGGGLTADCDNSSTAKLLWDATSGQFSCGTDQAGGTPGGSDTQVQFNDGGVFGGDGNFIWDKNNAIASFSDGFTSTNINGTLITTSAGDNLSLSSGLNVVVSANDGTELTVGDNEINLAPSGSPGVRIIDPSSGFGALLDTSDITASYKTFTFPNSNGTFCLTTSCVTSVATTYPVLGGPITTTGTLSLAFGTTTSNTWAGTQKFTNTGLQVFDPDGSHTLAIVPGSDLSGDRTLTINMDVSRSLTITGNSALDQNVRTSDSPSFVSVTLSSILSAARLIVTGIAAAFTPATEGEIGIDTTNHQVKYLSGAAVRVLSPAIDAAFVMATSSLGTGTTTIKAAGFRQATTFAAIGCNGVGSGTFVAQMGDGTASSTSVVSANGLTTTFTTLSANNVFTSGEAIFFAIGSVSGAVKDPTCSYQRTIDAT